MDIKDNSSSDNCLWLINAMKQYNSESDVSLYNWKRYNSKDDFNVIIKSFNVEEKTEYQSIIDRKGSVVTHDISVKLNGKVLPKESEKVISEMYKDTVIFLKEKIILYDNHTYNKEIILQKEEVKDNITYLDILYKNENVLIKYAVYPDNKIRAEKYAYNVKVEESEQQKYYFNNTFITYLSKSMYYDKDKSMEVEIKVGKEDVVDENTAVITIVQGNKDSGYNTVIEYLLKKYKKVNGQLILCEK